jgi:hypothetical protein
VDLDVGVVRIGLARQKRLDLSPGRLGLDGADGGLALGDRACVILGLAKLDQRGGVVQVLLQALDRGDSVLKFVALAHDVLRGVGVVPEFGVLGLGVQLGKASLSGVPVKDASSAVRSTAWRRQRAIRFRRAWSSMSSEGAIGSGVRG